MDRAAGTDGLSVGTITDVPGVTVGHHQRVGSGWQTGTTVVFAAQGATPGVSVRGGGPGTRETDALGPTHLVEAVHAVCLTGGSAFGLAAADGVMAELERRRLGFPIGPPEHRLGVVPVVPAAVIFDLGRGGRFDRRPDATFGERALRGARTRQSRWGAVGAGTGARAGGLQGGVGTASRTVYVPDAVRHVPVVVGALAVVNANGTVIDPLSGLPWVTDGFALRRPGRAERSALATAVQGRVSALNTTIGVVACSARLSKAEVSKLADVAHDGLARAVRPAHSMFDGDTIFGLATGDVEIGRDPAALGAGPSRAGDVNVLLAAAADCFATACARAVLSAERVGTAPSFRDLCPSAFRDRS
jgi:L-aminopeptidase/D-esterase-like protein